MDMARRAGRSYATMDLAGWRLLAKLAIECGWKPRKMGRRAGLAACAHLARDRRPAPCPAIAQEAETGEAEQHHRPGRKFGDVRAQFDIVEQRDASVRVSIAARSGYSEEIDDQYVASRYRPGRIARDRKGFERAVLDAAVAGVGREPGRASEGVESGASVCRVTDLEPEPP
jgi:hypothetical protein